jgi:hypothetical protein
VKTLIEKAHETAKRQESIGCDRLAKLTRELLAAIETAQRDRDLVAAWAAVRLNRVTGELDHWTPEDVIEAAKMAMGRP